MDAWASYYDYQSDEIEVEDAIGSARASSELDQSDIQLRNDRISGIRLHSLPPSTVPNASLEPLQEIYNQLFPLSQDDDIRRSTAPNSGSDSAYDPTSKHLPSNYDDTKTTGFVPDHLDKSRSGPRPEETFSYNATPPLALVERKMARTWIGLTWGEIKLLSLAGAGFLMDAYDLFIINMVYPILLLAYYPPGTRNIEWGLSGGVLKASTSMGNVVGQLLFGFLGDFWGRSVLYGKELMLAMFAIVLMISAPDSIHGKGVTIWLAVFRFLLGVGIGGDYPLSATVVADRSSSRTRGLLLSIIFSNQGWGGLCAALAAMAVVGGYKSTITSGNFGELSGAWRILFGLPLAPGFVVLYFRLTLVESARFVQARYLQDHDDLVTHASAVGMIVVENSKGHEVAIAPSSVYTSTDMIKRANKQRKISTTPSSLSSPLSTSDYKSYLKAGHNVARPCPDLSYRHRETYARRCERQQPKAKALPSAPSVLHAMTFGTTSASGNICVS